MSEQNLAGKPAIRYPDPLIKRVNPNGTQEYTAYQALFVWYWAAPPDDQPPLYFFGLSGLPAEQNLLSYLLFGSDYPAICTITSTYLEGGYFDDGTPNQFKNMTFNETAAFGLAAATNLCSLLQNGLSFLGQEAYKRILTGPTFTNGVTVSGFPQLLALDTHGIYATDPTAGPELPPKPDLSLRADVVLNSATVHSTSPYFGFEEGVDSEGDPTIVPQIVRQPVILYEPDLTQQIVDDGYTITLQNQLCGPTILDVVGIWSIEGYSPVPPAPALEMARAFAAPSSGMTSVDAALLVRALTGLSAINEAVKKSRG
jgi:hypothetical protein